MTVALRSEIQFTPTGLELPTDLSFEEWSDYGERLFAMERGVMWAIGDWWRFGEHCYGERAAQALDSRYAYQTFKDAGWVSGRVERSRRRDLLSFSHHKEVAALPPDDQDYWLDAAERGEWSRNELRARIKRGTAPDDAPDMPAIEEAATWDDLVRLMDSLDSFLSSDAPTIAAAVPPRRRAATARRLRKLGTGLGRIAWSLEGLEAPHDDDV
jgi:hypothetical protein